MTEYGKIVGCSIALATHKMCTNEGLVIYNPSPATLLGLNYFPVITEEKPAYNAEIEKLIEVPRQEDMHIVRSWLIIGEDLRAYTERKIVQSKLNLEDFFSTYKLISCCHGGVAHAYTVTEKKQAFFSQRWATHRDLVTAGIEDIMYWNTSGEASEPWTDEELICFMVELKALVVSVVSKQQDVEVKLRACVTLQEAFAIDITVNY